MSRLETEQQLQIAILYQRNAARQLSYDLDLGMTDADFDRLWGCEDVCLHPQLGILFAVPAHDSEDGQCSQCDCVGVTCPQNLDHNPGPECAAPLRRDHRDIVWAAR